jgi:hypothetical protein
MKRYVRHKGTGKYLTREGGWTEDLEKAWSLLPREAEEIRLSPEEAELYHCFPDYPEYNFIIPLSDTDPTAPWLSRRSLEQPQ